MNTAIEQYIRELSDLLCCDKATKQQFLSKFQQTLEDFEAEQENSPISYSDLVSEFDTPRAVSYTHLDVYKRQILSCGNDSLNKISCHRSVLVAISAIAE